MKKLSDIFGVNYNELLTGKKDTIIDPDEVYFDEIIRQVPMAKQIVHKNNLIILFLVCIVLLILLLIQFAPFMSSERVSKWFVTTIVILLEVMILLVPITLFHHRMKYKIVMLSRRIMKIKSYRKTVPLPYTYHQVVFHQDDILLKQRNKRITYREFENASMVIGHRWYGFSLYYKIRIDDFPTTIKINTKIYSLIENYKNKKGAQHGQKTIVFINGKKHQ